MTAFGPLTGSWQPFIAAAAVMLSGSVVTFAVIGSSDNSSWMIGMSAALAVSAVLLRLRVRSLRALTDSERAIIEVSTRDLLTGALNRHGLQDRIAALWTDAERRKEVVTVYFLDIRGLKHANDLLGHDVGDRILKDAADAITASVRASDLVVRWGGDEFVVVAVGESLSSRAFSERVNAAFTERSKVRRDHHIGAISVGRAAAPANAADFEQLERDADTDMYLRRALDAGRD